MLIRFLLSLPVWAVGTFILPWPLVPIAVAMADKDGRLPVFFRWLETHDNRGWQGPMSEPATAKHMDNPKKALRLWLWRNKAYTLRYRLGIPWGADWEVTKFKGRVEPRKVGPSFFYAEVTANGKRYFEFQPSLGLYWLRLYLRIGWKLKPYLGGKDTGSAGVFTGITPRTDDWDG